MPRAVEGADDDVVEDGKAGKRLHDLERAADACDADLVRPLAVDAPAVKQDLTGVRRKDPGNHVETGRLAGAIGTDQGDDAALRDFQARVRYRLKSAKGLGDRVDFEQGVHLATPSFFASEGQMPLGRNMTTPRRTKP